MPSELRRPVVVLATPAPVSHRTAEENLGLGYLASVLGAAGVTVELIDAWLEGLRPPELAGRIESVLSALEVAWIGFSCYRSNLSAALETIELLRPRLKCPLVAGGFGPTFSPGDFLNAGFDLVVAGEGESVVVPLTQALTSGHGLEGVPGLVRLDAGRIRRHPAPRPADLDSLPFPRRDTMIHALQRRTPIHVATSRGCEANCLFCSIAAFQKYVPGPRWRQRSIESIVEELEQLRDRGVQHVKIVDDSFIEPPRDGDWCKRLALTLRARALEFSFRTSIRADRVTPAVLAWLAEAGFVSLSCGIENFSASALSRMNKSASLDDNLRALDLFAEHGLLIQAGHILFDPYVTLDELEENLVRMRQYDWTISKGAFTEMYAADGTAFTTAINRRSLLRRDPGTLGNHAYEILDAGARRVYDAMKIWHRAHMRVYDRAIDPVSAPKALSKAELDTFSEPCRKLRRWDLEMLETAIRLAREGAPDAAIQSETQEQISRRAADYAALDDDIGRLYENVGLSYDAQLNPFITC